MTATTRSTTTAMRNKNDDKVQKKKNKKKMVASPSDSSMHIREVVTLTTRSPTTNTTAAAFAAATTTTPVRGHGLGRRRLPVAPPLYRWDHGEKDNDTVSVVTLDSAIAAPEDIALDRERTAVEQEQAQALTKKGIHKIPPRRPRRCASPPRNPAKIKIKNVPLKPLEFTRKRIPKQANQEDQDLPKDPLRATGIVDDNHEEEHEEDEEEIVEIKYDMAQPLSEITSSKTLLGATTTNASSPTNNSTGNDVSLVFCIRRTGCGQCREHALQLSALAQSLGPDVHMMGVIKPEAVPEAQLLEFYTDYFNFPLYQDDGWNLFTAMGGGRQISLWRMIKCAPKLAKRYYQKSIHNIPFGGDLWTHGGLLIFDKQQRLRFIYYEKYGDELDLEAIAWAIQDAKRPLSLAKDLKENHNNVDKMNNNNNNNKSKPSMPTKSTTSSSHGSINQNSLGESLSTFGGSMSSVKTPETAAMSDSRTSWKNNHSNSSKGSSSSPWSLTSFPPTKPVRRVSLTNFSGGLVPRNKATTTPKKAKASVDRIPSRPTRSTDNDNKNDNAGSRGTDKAPSMPVRLHFRNYNEYYNYNMNNSNNKTKKKNENQPPSRPERRKSGGPSRDDETFPHATTLAAPPNVPLTSERQSCSRSGRSGTPSGPSPPRLPTCRQSHYSNAMDNLSVASDIDSLISI